MSTADSPTSTYSVATIIAVVVGVALLLAGILSHDGSGAAHQESHATSWLRSLGHGYVLLGAGGVVLAALALYLLVRAAVRSAVQR